MSKHTDNSESVKRYQLQHWIRDENIADVLGMMVVKRVLSKPEKTCERSLAFCYMIDILQLGDRSVDFERLNYASQKLGAQSILVQPTTKVC